MNAFVSTLILSIGKAVFPFGIVFLVFKGGYPFVHTIPTLSVSPTEIPSPAPSPTISPTPALTLTPTPTLSPTPIPTNTPTQTPQPKADRPLDETPPPVTFQQLDEWFTTYSNHYSIDRQKLVNVAVCESNLNTNAVNEPYGGMFQFSSSTWRTARRAMNMDPNPDLRFDPEEAIKTAAFKISTSGISAWPNCGK